MLQIAFIILLTFEFYSGVLGSPYANIPPLQTPTLTTQPIVKPSSIIIPIRKPHSNGTITIPAPAATKPTASTFMITPSDYAMNSSSPDSVSKTQTQPGWSPSDVGTILFGCIGLVLGVLTLWLTFWLGRQRFRLIIKEGFQDELQLENLP